MNRFIIEHNIANFVQRFREATSDSQRGVLRELIVAEIAQAGDSGDQLQAVADWIRRLQQEIPPVADAGAQLNHRQLVQLLENRRQRLTAGE